MGSILVGKARERKLVGNFLVGKFPSQKLVGKAFEITVKNSGWGSKKGVADTSFQGKSLSLNLHLEGAWGSPRVAPRERGQGGPPRPWGGPGGA